MVAVKQKFPLLPDGTLDLPAWLQKIQDQFHLKNYDLIKKACYQVELTCKGLTTFYGQPTIEHALEIAEILLNLNLDQDSIVSAIIANTMENTSLTFEKIRAEFGDAIFKLVNGILQMNVLNSFVKMKKEDPAQIDLLRKTFLSMVSDIRVVLIKLAERTSLLRGIKNINPIERKRLAKETMAIYAPLANRLGIGQLKWELEDLAFHYMDPETYKSIAKFLAERRVDRENRIHEITARLKEQLAKMHIPIKLSARAKHIYSIYLKMQKKNLHFKDIYDYSAVRILVPTVSDCYTTLGIVHSIWEHIPEEFDDYISNPKPNGYRSIHTAVIGPNDKNMEIQIRTYEMHEQAEHGVAAHWVYKENKVQPSSYEAKITFLRQLFAWHKEVAKEESLSEKLNQQIFEDRVYVFTPIGDIVELPAGATSLDFAYHIHTELGHRCRGAKINGHIVPLSYTLQTGDQIEILTTKEGGPSRDWLNKDFRFIATNRARAKILQWFKHQETVQSIEHPVKSTLERETKLKPNPISHLPLKKTILDPKGLHIYGTENLLTHLAKCCKPIPGDPIVGFITLGRGVSIHRKLCSNILFLKPNHQNRFLDVSWDKEQGGNYYVDLQIRARGKEDLLKDISGLLPNLKIDLINLNSTFNKKNNLIFIIMTIQIRDLMQLQNLMTALKHMPAIIDVKRTRE